MINPCGEIFLWPPSESSFPALTASSSRSLETGIKVWPLVRKDTYERWVASARSRRTANQLELFVSRLQPSIIPGGEEYIWKDGQLYKAVRPWDQPQTPVAPWVRPQPVQPVTPQPGETWIGDIPGWYSVTWCSNNTEINKNANQEQGYVIWQ